MSMYVHSLTNEQCLDLVKCFDSKAKSVAFRTTNKDYIGLCVISTFYSDSCSFEVRDFWELHDYYIVGYDKKFSTVENTMIYQNKMSNLFGKSYFDNFRF